MSVPGLGALRIAATAAAPRWARHRVREACEGLSEEQQGIAELLTSELVSNAIAHPVRDQPDVCVEIAVEVYRTAEVLRVEVHDHDSRGLPPVRRPPTGCESGMGLYLVARLATAWGSFPHGDGKVVWFELSADPSAVRSDPSG